jgi:hypothetical protein
MVRELAGWDLLTPSATGWELTPTGRQALASGTYVIRSQSRQTFHFLDNEVPGAPPHFLAPARSIGIPAPAMEGYRFDAAVLQECVRQPPSWKQRRHFPADIELLFDLSNEGASSPDWRRVILDSPQQWTMVFVQTPPDPEGTCILGFSVRRDGWALSSNPPVLRLGEEWSEVLPDLAQEPIMESWRQAWRLWSQPRSFPPNEVAACTLERSDFRLLVRAPERLVERLRAARSDALKNETWLLAGSGRTRHAAQVQILE